MGCRQASPFCYLKTDKNNSDRIKSGAAGFRKIIWHSLCLFIENKVRAQAENNQKQKTRYKTVSCKLIF